MFRARVCPAHIGGFLAKTSPNKSSFGSVWLKSAIGSFPPKFIMKESMKKNSVIRRG